MAIRSDLKIRIASVGLNLKKVSELTNMPYFRIVKGINGYHKLDPFEEDLINNVLNRKNDNECPHCGGEL